MKTFEGKLEVKNPKQTKTGKQYLNVKIGEDWYNDFENLLEQIPKGNEVSGEYSVKKSRGNEFRTIKSLKTSIGQVQETKEEIIKMDEDLILTYIEAINDAYAVIDTAEVPQWIKESLGRDFPRVVATFFKEKNKRRKK